MSFSRCRFKYYISGVFFCLALSSGLKANAGPEFTMLKSMLGSRQIEPKMYLPQAVTIGSEIDVLVVAPGAKTIKLICSKESGELDMDGKHLRVAPDYSELGTENASRAEFKLKVDAEKYAEMIDKSFFFEALITYQDGLTTNAVFYGANAAYSNVNAVKVLAVQKDTAGAAAMAKAVMPGFFNQQQKF